MLKDISTAMPGRIHATTARSSDSLRDHFLLAMPCLTEGIFSHRITYICEHGESGAMGIVINQPLDLSVAEIFEHHKDPRVRASE